MEKNKKNIIKEKSKTDITWIISITLLAFVISLTLAFISELIIPGASLIVNVITIVLFIAINIVSDTIGVAIQSAEGKVFNSMSAKKLKGATTAIDLIKNKEKVSSFCCDVIGDICGVLSGSCGLTIAQRLSGSFNTSLVVTIILMTGIISALTIAGKAFGKVYAVNKSNEIIYNLVKVLSVFNKN